jgi:aminoglycoside phosphotransferase (APT) family kinase protein
MADAPVFSKGRDLEATADALSRWLAPRLEVDEVDVRGLDYPRGAGISNETILFEAESSRGVEQLVLRPAPRADYQVFLDTDIRVQFDLLRTLHEGGFVRVPEVLWYEDDPEIIGQAFFIMRRMFGKVPVTMPCYSAEGWLFDATPSQRRTAWESAMEQFAAVHRVPVDDVSFLDRPELGPTGLAQQIGYWTRYIPFALGDDAATDVVAPLFEWLGETMPAEAPGLCWGDARLGNMMFGDDFRVVGVMDWEQATLAGGLEDLAWWIQMDEGNSVDRGLPRLEGLGDREETIGLWTELTGLSTDDLHWHEVFSATKTGLLSYRTIGLMTREGVAMGAGHSPFAKAYKLLDREMPSAGS